jgi:phosphoglycerol transferase MdoB-like AlkP superfamily enzyme
VIEDQEITPNLNKILSSEKTIYASHVVPQTYYGRSSDAQLMINTGLLPADDGAAFVKYYTNTYYTVAKALKEKANYNCYTFLAKVFPFGTREQ